MRTRFDQTYHDASFGAELRVTTLIQTNSDTKPQAEKKLGSMDARDLNVFWYEEVSKGMKTTIRENADNGEIKYERVSKGMKTTIWENVDFEEIRYEEVSKGMKTTIRENDDLEKIRYE